ncbi:hypothetical protein PF001_g32109 [Phytophthora fragariae]|uniref:Uncharacterized protein n=1 Tax=Phytophthora fragariae TaxID=53985 RepID=A0A6A4AXL5_9STRA|nr:hypothetical protein PF001_g32109 [Phytophthora fragariae]
MPPLAQDLYRDRVARLEDRRADAGGVCRIVYRGAFGKREIVNHPTGSQWVRIAFIDDPEWTNPHLGPDPKDVEIKDKAAPEVLLLANVLNEDRVSIRGRLMVGRVDVLVGHALRDGGQHTRIRYRQERVKMLVATARRADSVGQHALVRTVVVWGLTTHKLDKPRKAYLCPADELGEDALEILVEDRGAVDNCRWNGRKRETDVTQRTGDSTQTNVFPE